VPTLVVRRYGQLLASGDGGDPAVYGDRSVRRANLLLPYRAMGSLPLLPSAGAIGLAYVSLTEALVRGARVTCGGRAERDAALCIASPEGARSHEAFWCVRSAPLASLIGCGAALSVGGEGVPVRNEDVYARGDTGSCITGAARALKPRREKRFGWSVSEIFGAYRFCGCRDSRGAFGAPCQTTA